jgi:predicted TIM-barrel fold metal-dependent hydrolase
MMRIVLITILGMTGSAIHASKGELVASQDIYEFTGGERMTHDRPPKSRLTRRGVLSLAGESALVSAVIGEHALARAVLPGEEQVPIPAIDAHVHVVPSRLPGIKPVPGDVAKLYEGPPAGLAARVKAEMGSAGIKVAFGMGSVGAENEDPLGIAGTLALSKSVPGLKAVGIADPRFTDPAHLRAVEAQIERHRDKIVAFKAYLGYLHFGPEDPAYVPYYRLAAKHDLPVILHTGDNWSTTAKVKYAHPLRMDEVAVDHPEVRFVLAHFGNPWLIDAAEVIYKNPNVWADLSGLFVGSEQDIQSLLDAGKTRDAAAGLVFSDLKKAIGYVGDSKRFLYGSDWPLAPMASYRRGIEALIPKEQHHEVFRTNAEHVFKLSIV